ncbi:hypothetical protein Q427_28325 [Halomonas sp. BC04]|nr:hypothetical protein Q427_28325 [Halomonas sp. BC04]
MVLPRLAVTIDVKASAEAPIGASRDGDQRSDNDVLHQRCLTIL